ncbi:unnamed protein product [Pseudo-nitzschia multistriata]|uniref:Septum formation protein Maf n=1 Tax=Pseudo-nitzschia multistriata TaxID=183589 RepID=A0A448ZEQ6_9STRA|nr:unnamed protein product [Pseudo-nitzschia multistriata]
MKFVGFQPLFVILALIKESYSFTTRDSFSTGSRTTMSAATETDDANKVEEGNLLVSLGDKLDCDATKNMPKLILASQSPRRREILDMMGLREDKQYLVETSPLDESKLQVELGKEELTSIEYTRRLAEAKAIALAEAHVADRKEMGVAYYLGSDTIVELDESILEKPKDADDAKRMLNLLSGRQHHVHTGVALYRLDSTNQITLVDSFVDTACVTFTDLSDADIDAYIISGEPMDKAGSYGIQGIGGQFVKEISGDFFAVMGLPMHRTSKLVAKALQAE